MVLALRRALAVGLALTYVAAQVCGGVLGSWLAHAMYTLPILAVSQKTRTGTGQWLAEGVATFGLLATILGGVRFRAEAVPWRVGLYIIATCWFTASTSFANPAVAIARAFSDTFAGIRPSDVPAFIVAQAIGALVSVAVFGGLLTSDSEA